jgi:hypothetical protein
MYQLGVRSIIYDILEKERLGNISNAFFAIRTVRIIYPED